MEVLLHSSALYGEHSLNLTKWLRLGGSGRWSLDCRSLALGWQRLCSLPLSYFLPFFSWYMSHFVQDTFRRLPLKWFLVTSTGLLFLPCFPPRPPPRRPPSWNLGRGMQGRTPPAVVNSRLFWMCFREARLSLSVVVKMTHWRVLLISFLTIWRKLSWSLCAWSLLSKLLPNETNVFFIMMRSFLRLLVFKASCFYRTKLDLREREREDDDLKKEKEKQLLCVCAHVFY